VDWQPMASVAKRTSPEILAASKFTLQA